jgi:hypothetical protein
MGLNNVTTLDCHVVFIFFLEMFNHILMIVIFYMQVMVVVVSSKAFFYFKFFPKIFRMLFNPQDSLFIS